MFLQIVQALNSPEPPLVSPEYVSMTRGSSRNYVQVSCLLALPQFTRCFWGALGGCMSHKATRHPAACARYSGTMGQKKQLKSVSPCASLSMTQMTLVDLKCVTIISTCAGAAWIVVTDTQLIASFPFPFPCQLRAYLTKGSSLHKWVTLLDCFATNQGHCMLIKFTVDGLSRINAQAHNRHYSFNIFQVTLLWRWFHSSL